MKEAQKVEYVRSHERLSYRDAVSRVRSTKQHSGQAVTVDPQSIQRQSLSAPSSKSAGIARVNIGTQTEPSFCDTGNQTLAASFLSEHSPLVTIIMSLFVKILERADLVPGNKLSDVCALLSSELGPGVVVVPPVQPSVSVSSSAGASTSEKPPSVRGSTERGIHHSVSSHSSLISATYDSHVLRSKMPKTSQTSTSRPKSKCKKK